MSGLTLISFAVLLGSLSLAVLKFFQVLSAISGLGVSDPSIAAPLPRWSTFLDQTPESIERTISLNCNHVVQLTWHYLSRMVRNNYGRIILVSSVSGFCHEMGYPVYCPSKTFVNRFAEMLRFEMEHLLGNSEIQIMTLCPGLVKTPMIGAALGHLEGLDIDGIMGAVEAAGVPLMTPEECADVTYDAYAMKHPVVIPGPLYYFSCWIPDAIGKWIYLWVFKEQEKVISKFLPKKVKGD